MMTNITDKNNKLANAISTHKIKVKSLNESRQLTDVAPEKSLTVRNPDTNAPSLVGFVTYFFIIFIVLAYSIEWLSRNNEPITAEPSAAIVTNQSEIISYSSPDVSVIEPVVPSEKALPTNGPIQTDNIVQEATDTINSFRELANLPPRQISVEDSILEAEQQPIEAEIIPNRNEVIDFISLTKVAPIYPASALRRAIEGYCIVQFDINTNGLTENPTIVSCSHSVFERASIIAAEQFTYSPRTINGVPVKVFGERNRITFELSDS